MTETTAAEKPQDKSTEGDGATVTDLVSRRSAALEIQSGQAWWTPSQAAALESIGLGETPDGDRMAFLHLCQATGLDPFRREIYLIGRKDGQKIKWTAQTGIDGFRHIAQRTGEYLGREDPQWCGPDMVWQDVWLGGADNPPAAARITVKRKMPDGEIVRTTATAVYAEFVPMKAVWENNRRTGEEKPQGLWGKMPSHMLAKCAEALAIRSAFPRQAAGVFLHEEMEQADVASKADAAEQQAEARRLAREQGAARPWAAREGVILGETVPAAPDAPAEAQAAAEPPATAVEPEVVDAEIVSDEPAGPSVDREALLAELDEQAQVLGQTRSAMLRRWVAQHRMNVEDAPDEALLALVIERREVVAYKRQQDAGKPGS